MIDPHPYRVSLGAFRPRCARQCFVHICAGTGQVHFVGEEAIDEGGVQKEFFQLIVRETFDPKFADPPAVPTNRSANFRGFALARGEAPPACSDCAE